MIPYHVYYLLTAMGCLWLCIMLHHGWPRRSSVSHQKPTEPLPLQIKRKRSNEAKPFESLTQRPYCAACEHDAIHPKPQPPLRPDPMPPTHRRPRVIDTSRHCCPHTGCAHSIGLSGRPTGLRG